MLISAPVPTNRTRVARLLQPSPRDARLDPKLALRDEAKLPHQPLDLPEATVEASLLKEPSSESLRAERQRRRQTLSERAEQFLQSSLESRALLREVEQMLWTASREPVIGEEEEIVGAATMRSIQRPASSAGPSYSSSFVTTSCNFIMDPAEQERMRRLHRCDELQSALEPVRSSLDVYGGRVSEAADENERLRKELSQVLEFNEHDIAAELHAQGLTPTTQPEIQVEREGEAQQRTASSCISARPQVSPRSSRALTV